MKQRTLFNLGSKKPKQDKPIEQPKKHCKVKLNFKEKPFQTFNMSAYEEIVICEHIRRLRLQMLVHSCIYYHFNDNIITNKQFDERANKLKSIQDTYPQLSEKVEFYEVFKDWDGSSGFNLPYTDDWVMDKALNLMHARRFMKTEEDK